MVGRSMNQEGRLFYYDKKNEAINWVKYTPEIDNPPTHNLHNLYAGPLKIRPDNSKIVHALLYFKRIDVFTSCAEHIISYALRDSPEDPGLFKDPNNPFPNTLMYYYMDLFLSDKLIYALNVNIPMKEFNDFDSGYSELHVFSFDGEFIDSYNLNHLIFSIAIDEDEGYLYGLRLPAENEYSTKLVRFKL